MSPLRKTSNESKARSIRVRIATRTAAALTTVLAVASLTTTLAAASPVRPASLPNCADNGIKAPCFEQIWSDGSQVKMTFLNFNPPPSSIPTRNFYVVAPQGETPPQGTVPFLHDHVIGDVQSQKHGDRRGNDRVRYHAFFVLCSAQGISSGGCVPTMTSIPGLGTIPFATTVNGHKLTSADPIEAPENSGLLTIMDTGGVLIATINSRHMDR